MWPRKKLWWETGGYPGERTRIPDPNARFRQNPFPGTPEMIDPNWSGVPRSWQSNIMSPGAKSSMTQGTQAAMSGSAGGGKWKKVLEHLGKMTGPEPDWSLSPQKMGVPSPWSPTNVAWSPVGADMFGRKKKKGPY